MNRDDEDAALAHQQELERQREQQLLTNDPAYMKWLDELNEQVHQNEISGQSNR